jgi:hypothetical protein
VLNILDANWLSQGSRRGYPASATTRADSLCASRDLVALEYWAAKNILLPIDGNPCHSPESEDVKAWFSAAKDTIIIRGGFNLKDRGIYAMNPTYAESEIAIHQAAAGSARVVDRSIKSNQIVVDTMTRPGPNGSRGHRSPRSPRLERAPPQERRSQLFSPLGLGRVLSAIYGFAPACFTCCENGRLGLVMPFMEIVSRLTGRRGVSLSFTDLCNPPGAGATPLGEAARAVIEFGRGSGPGYHALGGRSDPRPRSREEIAGDSRLAEREPLAKYRKAVKAGPSIPIERSRESPGIFFRIHCRTR